VTLPQLGTIRTHKNTRKLHRHLAAGTARVLSATVRREGGRWYVAFQCEVQREVRRPARPGAVIGVDLGITHLAVLSSGTMVDNPRHLEHALAGLRRPARTMARRQGPVVYDPARAPRHYGRRPRAGNTPGPN